jgi:AmmeMemoRadiSam system protein B
MRIRKRSLPEGWYPGSKRECVGDIASYMGDTGEEASPPTKLVGGIVPHAGWYFSGRLAARVFAALRGEEADTIVLFGGHLGPRSPACVVMEDEWETPLGNIVIDADFREGVIKELRYVEEPPYAGDNTIEVQLPLVKYFFPNAKLFAVRSPLSLDAIELGKKVVEVARRRGAPIVAVGSTDLTHYGPNYGFVPKGRGEGALTWVKEVNDKGFVDRALRMDAAGLIEHAEAEQSACSGGAAASAIAVCQEMGAASGTLLDYYTSYDVMPNDSFVGYAGIVF